MEAEFELESESESESRDDEDEEDVLELGLVSEVELTVDLPRLRLRRRRRLLRFTIVRGVRPVCGDCPPCMSVLWSKWTTAVAIGLNPDPRSPCVTIFFGLKSGELSHTIVPHC